MSFAKRMIAALELGRRTLSPTCREAARLQVRAREGRLTSAQRFGLRVHLVLCGWCRRYGRELDALRRLLSRGDAQPDFNPAPGLAKESRERIRRALERPPQ